MVRKHKVLLTVATWLLFSLALSSATYAGIWDKFKQWDSFEGLNPSFERLANPRGSEDLKPAFKQLTESKQNFSAGLNPSFARMTNIGKMSTVLNPALAKLANFKGIGGLKPSFTGLGRVSPSMAAPLKPALTRMVSINPSIAVKPAFERLANVNAGMIPGLKPSLTNLAKINTNMEVKPSFARLTNLNTGISGKVNPALSRLTQISPTVAIKPDFARLTNLNPAMSGRLNPALTRLTSVNANVTIRPSFSGLVTVNTGLARNLNPALVKLSRINAPITVKPSLTRMAAVNSNLSRAVNPALSRLSTSVNIPVVVNPTFARLTAKPQRLTDITLKIASSRKLAQVKLPLNQKINRYNIPVSLNSASRLAYVRKPELRKITLAPRSLRAPVKLSQLSFKPMELKSITSTELAQVIQKDLHLIRPQAQATAPRYELGPHSVSLHSLLAIEGR